jgi:aphidicolan-16beta-ol synthase/syn-copalyl-diphosphate synthase
MAAKIAPWTGAESGPTDKILKAVDKFVQFFSQLPLFKDEPEWRLRASLIEGYLFLPEIKAAVANIFSRKEGVEDKYLEYIPFTWTTVNNMQSSPLEGGFLRDMMMVSMLIYQSDEYMEGVIGKCFKHNLTPIKRIIRRLCRPPLDLSEAPQEVLAIHNQEAFTPEASSPIEPDLKEADVALAEVEQTLSRFVSYFLDHPKVKQASVHDQALAYCKLRDFLLAHCTQIEDNTRLSQQQQPWNKATATALAGTGGRTYHEWVNTTSAEHTSCPFSFYLVACHAHPRDGSDFFAGAQQKYVAESLCRHLATMCRQYNDFGSVARDRSEGNLNSVNFPEFYEASTTSEDAKLKADLFEIAEFERECLETSVRKLETKVSKRVMDVVKVFVYVTDLYGQIYVVRDLSNWMD